MGSSAKWVSIPVRAASRVSMPWSRLPPPVRRMPLTATSAASSGRRALQDCLDGGDDVLRHRCEGFRSLLPGEKDLPGQPRVQAPALDRQGFLSRPVHPPDGLLDLFRGAGADEQAVLLADVLHEGLVKLIPGGGEAGGGHHAPQGGDRHVGGPAPDVHHHVALGWVMSTPAPRAAARGSSIR